MSTNIDLKAVIEGCTRGDRRSQEQLFRHLYGKMIVVCMRYTNDRDSAEEVLQEGFIKVFDKLDVFDFIGSFEGWVRRIMVNTAIDYIRKNKKNPFLSDQDTDFRDETINPTVEKELEEMMSDKGALALQAINQLSPAYRTIFNMYVIEEYTHREIAEILGISEGTSKSNLAKARMRLQTLLLEQFKLID